MTEIKSNTNEARMTLWAVRSHCSLELRGWKQVSTVLNGVAEVPRAFWARPSPFFAAHRKKRAVEENWFVHMYKIWFNMFTTKTKVTQIGLILSSLDTKLSLIFFFRLEFLTDGGNHLQNVNLLWEWTDLLKKFWYVFKVVLFHVAPSRSLEFLHSLFLCCRSFYISFFQISKQNTVIPLIDHPLCWEKNNLILYKITF